MTRRLLIGGGVAVVLILIVVGLTLAVKRNWIKIKADTAEEMTGIPSVSEEADINFADINLAECTNTDEKKKRLEKQLSGLISGLNRKLAIRETDVKSAAMTLTVEDWYKLRSGNEEEKHKIGEKFFERLIETKTRTVLTPYLQRGIGRVRLPVWVKRCFPKGGMTMGANFKNPPSVTINGSKSISKLILSNGDEISLNLNLSGGGDIGMVSISYNRAEKSWEAMIMGKISGDVNIEVMWMNMSGGGMGGMSKMNMSGSHRHMDMVSLFASKSF